MSPLLPEHRRVGLVDRTTEGHHDDLAVIATRDHELIQRWAERRHAEPATGEATASGPKTIEVNDDGAGIRFNFPGVSQFRPVDWDEWFANFDRFSLVFIYERDRAGVAPSHQYRLMSLEALKRVADLV